MKKRAVFTLVTCCLAALVLLSVLVVGLSTDNFGLKTLVRDAEQEWTVSGEHRYESTWDPTEDEVDGFDINWVNGRVELKVSSDNMIRITESADRELDEADRMKLSYSGGTLKINWGSAWITFSIFENRRKDLVIEVPREIAGKLEKLNCTTTSGPIDISGFTAEDLNISSTSGKLELSDLKGDSADISTTSGDITLEKISLSDSLSTNTVSGKTQLSGVKAESADLDTVSGAIKIEGTVKELSTNGISAVVSAELSRCPDSVNMNSVSGSLILYLPENEGFEVNYSSVSGSFTSEFPTTGSTGKSGRAMYASGESSFSFSTTSGDINIRRTQG